MKIEAFDNCIDIIPKSMRKDYSLWVNPQDMKELGLDLHSYRGYIVRYHPFVPRDRIYFSKEL